MAGRTLARDRAGAEAHRGLPGCQPAAEHLARHPRWSLDGRGADHMRPDPGGLTGMERRVVRAAAAVAEPVSRGRYDPEAIVVEPVRLGVVDDRHIPCRPRAVPGIAAVLKRVGEMRGPLEPDARAVFTARAHAAEPASGDGEVTHVPAERRRIGRIPESQV